VNSDLIGKYVNIASRAAGFVSKLFAGKLAYLGDTKPLLDGAKVTAMLAKEQYTAREFGQALRTVMATADRINEEFDAAKPWLLAKDPARHAELQDVCSRALHGFKLLSVLLAPVLPVTASRTAQELFGISRDWDWSDWAVLPEHINPYQHLMQRVEPKQLDALFDIEPVDQKQIPPSPPFSKRVTDTGTAKEKTVNTTTPPIQPSAPIKAEENSNAIAPTISIDEFSKIDLRVAEILSAEHVEGADKLLKLTLFIGDETRTVFAGIKSAYDPADLAGRLTVMVANLAPRKMRFGESQGMVLAASGEGPGIFLLSPDSGAVPGMRVK
jgi:methionyl-tRNA synthetase